METQKSAKNLELIWAKRVIDTSKYQGLNLLGLSELRQKNHVLIQPVPKHIIKIECESTTDKALKFEWWAEKSKVSEESRTHLRK